MADLEHVYAAIHREEQAQEDLAAYLRNAHMRRIERDDDHEHRLREEIVASSRAVEEAIEARRRDRAADLCKPTAEGVEGAQS